jgi:hypothetical protein
MKDKTARCDTKADEMRQDLRTRDGGRRVDSKLSRGLNANFKLLNQCKNIQLLSDNMQEMSGRAETPH